MEHSADYIRLKKRILGLDSKFEKYIEKFGQKLDALEARVRKRNERIKKVMKS